MKLEFERKDGLSCVEFLYKAMAQYYSKDYELAFIDAWSFSYDASTGVATSNEGNRESNFRKYHGIKVTSNIVEGRENIIRRVKMILAAKNMCIMRTDLYYIPWSAANYGKLHLNHSVLIIDVSTEGFLCVDFSQTKGEVLPFDHIPEQVGIAFFELETPEVILETKKDCVLLLEATLSRGITDNQAFERMKQFSDALNDAFNIHEIIPDAEGFEDSYFLASLNRIAQCRFQFASALEYLRKMHPSLNFLEIEAMLRKSAVFWKSITALLIKSYLSAESSSIIRKVSNKVLEVKALEEHAYVELQKEIKGTGRKEVGKRNNLEERHAKKNMLWQFVDISNYANHKAFGDLVNTQQARYEQNRFMVLDCKLDQEILVHDSLCFKLGNLRADKYDNIECAEQVIEINSECSEIALLANAEYDHQVDCIEVLGRKLKRVIEISTSSWRCTPILDDTVVWCGIGALQFDEKIVIELGEKRLFGKIYKIPQMYVKKICLPNNPNFHIFALSIR